MEGMGEYWASRFLTMKPEAFLRGPNRTGLSRRLPSARSAFA